MNGKNLERFAPLALSVLRILAGLLFMEHGLQKFLYFPPGPMAGSGWLFAQPAAYAGIIELFAGILIGVGFLTRFAAFLASGTMAAAYFIGHAPTAFWPVNNAGDAAILYCFVFLYFVFSGAGPLSLDAKRTRTRDAVVRPGSSMRTRV